jgi:hypothetical protein
MLLACAGCPCATCLPATHRQARRECRRRQTRRKSHVGDLCVLCASAFSRSLVPDAIYLGNSVTAPCAALPPASLQSSCIPAVVLDRCSRRGPTSATAPCVALAPASLQSSSVPGVVRPWSRALRAPRWNIPVRLRIVTPLTERPPITDLESCAPARERSRHVPPQ